tara:strand:+ start:409 stop:606 length:198 start_codon:yes stop_codon:yes gene_type:complete
MSYIPEVYSTEIGPGPDPELGFPPGKDQEIDPADVDENSVVTGWLHEFDIVELYVFVGAGKTVIV